jgi:hypothetical protein
MAACIIVELDFNLGVTFSAVTACVHNVASFLKHMAPPMNNSLGDVFTNTMHLSMRSFKSGHTFKVNGHYGTSRVLQRIWLHFVKFLLWRFRWSYTAVMCVLLNSRVSISPLENAINGTKFVTEKEAIN